MADQVVQPGEQQVRLVAHRALQAAAVCLERFQAAAQPAGLRACQDGDRRGTCLQVTAAWKRTPMLSSTGRDSLAMLDQI
jgi:hypothetical protein